MDKEKEIEELAEELEKGKEYPYINTPTEMAERLVLVGYGNVKQAVKEVADRLKERSTNRITALKNSEEECQEVGDWETAARCKVAYNEIENVLNGLNQIITELYREGK